MLAVALFYFVVSNVAQMDTIFGFNLSFAALAAGISARFAKKLWRLVVVVLIAWAAMSIRTYWAEGQSQAGADVHAGRVLAASSWSRSPAGSCARAISTGRG